MPHQVQLVADPLAAARDSQLSIFSHNKRQVLALQVKVRIYTPRNAAKTFQSARFLNRVITPRTQALVPLIDTINSQISINSINS